MLAIGIVPLSILLFKETNFKFCNRARAEGIDPTILFDASLISDKLDIILNSVGIVPLKELCSKQIYFTFFNLPNPSGIVPFILLWLSSKMTD